MGGGVIKYKYETFTNSVPALIRMAEQLNIPIVLNAVGVEDYDPNDYRCRRMKKYLNKEIVKHITTRDDIDTLYNKYYDGHPNIPCYAVADSAVWSSDCFNVSLKNQDSIQIGLCVARGNLFVDNGVSVPEKQLIELYVELVEHLVNDGYEVTVFTNGANCDKNMAFEVGGRIKDRYRSKVNVWFPDKNSNRKNEAVCLIDKISTFKAVIATRLHACIISYSLGVPCVGLVWNDKLIFWGKNISCEENYIRMSDFKSEKIIVQLKRAMKTSIDENGKQIFKNSVSNSILDVTTMYTRTINRK